MEPRSGPSKPKRFERDRIDAVENRVGSRLTVTVSDAADTMAANRLRSETLSSSTDALLRLVADAVDATPASFDSEPVERGAELL